MSLDSLLSGKRAAEFGQKLDFVSKNLETLFHDVSSILNTTAKLRNKTLAFSEHLKSYSEGETPGLRQALAGLSDCLRQIEDHRRRMYDRVVEKVYRALNCYADKCAEARGWKQQYEKASKKANETAGAGGNGSGTSGVSAELEEKERQNAVYVDRMRRFEQEKISDVKAIAGNWVHSHLEFCSRSMELLSEAHQLVLLVDETPELAQSLRGVAPNVDANPPPPPPQAPTTASTGSPSVVGGVSSGKPSPLRNEVSVLGSSLGSIDSPNSRSSINFPTSNSGNTTSSSRRLTRGSSFGQSTPPLPSNSNSRRGGGGGLI